MVLGGQATDWGGCSHNRYAMLPVGFTVVDIFGIFA